MVKTQLCNPSFSGEVKQMDAEPKAYMGYRVSQGQPGHLMGPCINIRSKKQYCGLNSMLLSLTNNMCDCSSVPQDWGKSFQK